MKKIIIALVAAYMTLASSVVSAEAPFIGAEKRILENSCVAAQINLQRVQEADLLARINRGRRYGVLLKLMTNFNGRVVQNKIDAPELVTIASNYQKSLVSFRQEYTAYDDLLRLTIQVDCIKQPAIFKQDLEKLRQMRLVLNKRVNEFDELLDGYKAGVDKIKLAQKASE